MAAAAPEVVGLGEILAAAFLLIAWGALQGTRWGYQRSLKRVIVGFANLIDVGINVGFKTVHPFGSVASWLRAQAQNIDTLLAEGILASERGAVVLFKLFMNTQLWIATEIKNLALDTWHALQHVSSTTIHTTTRIIDAKTKALITSIAGRVGTLIHVTVPHLAHSLARTEAQVAHLTHALAHDVATLPSRVGITSKQLRREARRIDALEKKVVGLGAVALVTTALVRMGFKWIKCDAAKSVGRRLNCGSFAFLESLLGLALDALIITNLCTVTKTLTRVANLFQPVLVDFTTGIVDLMKCQGSSRPADLHLNAADLPPLEVSTIAL